LLDAQRSQLKETDALRRDASLSEADKLVLDEHFA
jgi:hypothetical protein